LLDKIHANRIAKEIWEHDTPNLSTELEWHLRNPNTLAIVRDANNAAVGYFDFVPVKPSFIDDLLTKKKLNEYDLVEQMVPSDFTGLSLRTAEIIYIAGIGAAKLRGVWEQTVVRAFLSFALAKIVAEATLGHDCKRRVKFVAVAYDGDSGDGLDLCLKAHMHPMGDFIIDGDPDSIPHPWFLREYSLEEARAEPGRLGAALSGVDTRLHLSDHSTQTRRIYRLERSRQSFSRSPNDRGRP
jgi:hypothetical protein